MIRWLKIKYAAWQFKRATAAFDREIAVVRAKHGRVSDAALAKRDALHRALAQAVRG